MPVSKAMNFDWNPEKARANLAKHGVSFAEARRVFADPFLLVLPDDRHSADEVREIALGMVPDGWTLVVVHTLRWSYGEEYLRIISARKANRTEEVLYFQKRGTR